MQKEYNILILFFIIVTILILGLVAFIIIMLYLYRKKQVSFLQSIEKIKLDHEKNLLSTQLEIQEQTFENISREIHDNISLSLTLAKLNLNTIDLDNKKAVAEKIHSSVDLLGQAITDLTAISKGLNSNVIIQHGLVKALEDEVKLIQEAKLFTVDFRITGHLVYMDTQKELIIFRIIQEAFNNIIKHACTCNAELRLFYDSEHLNITVSDSGKGFELGNVLNGRKAGLENMRTRIKMLHGNMKIESYPLRGTTLYFTIPLN